MNAERIQQKLRTIEGLHSVTLIPVSEVATPFFHLRGFVLLHGEPYSFSTEIKIDEFNSTDEVARLGASLLAAAVAANNKLKK